MQLIQSENRYVVISEYHERHIPKAAGFLWDPNAKRWWTKDVKRAALLVDHASPELRDTLLPMAGAAKAEQEAETQRKEASREASRATNADIDVPCNPGMAYLPYQKAGIAYAMQHPHVLFGDDMGLGKGQPLSTRVATPTGWRPIGKLRVGDMVIGSHGLPTRVMGVFPQGKRPIWRVTFTDGYSVRCDDAHLWSVKDRNRMVRGMDWRVINTPDLARCHLRDQAGRSNYAIPRVRPVHYEGQSLPIPAYALGVLLGDGSLTGSSLEFSCPPAKQNIADILSRHLPNGYTLEPHNHGTTSRQLRITSPHWHCNYWLDAVRRMGLDVLSAALFIPPEYLTAPISQRLELLRGLMDTDGSASDNRLTFHTTAERLAYDVAELVQSLGGLAIVRRYDRSHEEKGVEWQVNVQLDEFCPFYLPYKFAGWKPASNRTGKYRYIESVEPTGETEETVCIAVDSPDKLYVTEHYIVTHNTIQAIGTYNADPSIQKVLIICPASLKLNWRREWMKWAARKSYVGIAEGKHFPRHCDVVILNFDIAAKWRPTLDQIPWDMLIIDECHACKNPRAQRTQAILGKPAGRGRADGIPPIQAKRRLFLTGTPILNRPSELWTLVQSLDPKGLGKSYWGFHSRYCNASRGRFGTDTSGASNLDELQDRLRAGFMIRRLKSEVLTELPPKRRQIIELDPGTASMTIAAERQRYQAREAEMEQLRIAATLAEAAEDEAAFREAVRKLRAVMTSAFEDISRLRHQTAVAKIPHVIAHLEDTIESNKIVCFAHHLDVIQAIAKHFGDQAVTLTGQTKIEDRQAAVDRFQTDPSCKLFVGNILAAGVGITLTASSHVVMAELDWRPGIVTQAEDRTHRIGQKSNVLVQHLVFNESLDAVMAQRIIDKQEIIEAALDNRTDTTYEEDDVDLALDQAIAAASGEAEVAQAEREARAARKKTELPPLTLEQVNAIMTGLSIMVARDPDRARDKNDIGFNAFDGKIGHALANLDRLTVKQAHLGRKILLKYRRQLGEDLTNRIKGT